MSSDDVVVDQYLIEDELNAITSRVLSRLRTRGYISFNELLAHLLTVFPNQESIDYALRLLKSNDTSVAREVLNEIRRRSEDVFNKSTLYCDKSDRVKCKGLIYIDMIYVTKLLEIRYYNPFSRTYEFITVSKFAPEDVKKDAVRKLLMISLLLSLIYKTDIVDSFDFIESVSFKIGLYLNEIDVLPLLMFNYVYSGPMGRSGMFIIPFNDEYYALTCTTSVCSVADPYVVSRVLFSKSRFVAKLFVNKARNNDNLYDKLKSVKGFEKFLMMLDKAMPERVSAYHEALVDMIVQYVVRYLLLGDPLDDPNKRAVIKIEDVFIEDVRTSLVIDVSGKRYEFNVDNESDLKRLNKLVQKVVNKDDIRSFIKMEVFGKDYNAVCRFFYLHSSAYEFLDVVEAQLWFAKLFKKLIKNSVEKYAIYKPFVSGASMTLVFKNNDVFGFPVYYSIEVSEQDMKFALITKALKWHGIDLP